MDPTAVSALSRAAAPAAVGGVGPVQPGGSGAATAGGFGTVLQDALQHISASQNQAAQMQQQFQMENPDVGLEDTMIALNKANLSFQAAVQVRNRLVQAYEQVMSMPL